MISTRMQRIALFFLVAGCDQQRPEGPLLHEDAVLAPPPTPEEGFQYVMDPFDVPPGQEIQNCYFFDVPYDEEVCIGRIEVAQNSGTHHMNIFRPEEGTIADLDGEPGTAVLGGSDRTSPCWVSGNWFDWPLVVNSQQSTPGEGGYEWRLPDGVAQKFVPHEKLMLQSHYVNAATQAGERGVVLVNFWRVPCEGTQELGTMFATNQGINVCPGDVDKTFETSCGGEFSQPVTITAANSHYHSRGIDFTIELYDPIADDYGEPFYENRSWNDPVMATGLDVQVPAGQRIGWHCSYTYRDPQDPYTCSDLGPGCCYTFGPTVETREHCNIFVYYYPKIADYNCI
jgi:hypothetical protein